jgi:hypothetical protein
MLMFEAVNLCNWSMRRNGNTGTEKDRVKLIYG